MTICNNLNRMMKEQKITQAQLAFWLNVSRQAVHRWCKGIAVPRTRLLLELADVLKCNVEDLVDEEEV